MTQIEEARRGRITPEMEFVARREGLEPETIRAEVARGRMVIPANSVHLRLGLEPMGNRLLVDPAVPAEFGEIRLLEIPGRWDRCDAFGRARPESRSRAA